MYKVEEKKDNSVRNMIVGAAVVGAGVVAATVLSKKENREKVGKAITDVGDKGKKVISDIKGKKDEVVKNIEREFNYIKGNIEKSSATGVKELKKELDLISKKVEEIKKSNKENVEDLITQVKDSMRNLRKDFDRMSSK